MQQTNELMKNPSKWIENELAKKIRQDYFQPFIEALKKAHIDENEIIQETFRHLQIYYAELIHPLLKQKLSDIKFLHDFDNESLPEGFKTKILAHPNLKEKIIQLGFLYLDESKQNKDMLGYKGAEIRTQIRELFYNYLNPLPQMKLDQSKINSILPITKSSPKPTTTLNFFSIPFEIQQHIYSYLDYKSRFSFKRLCKNGYFVSQTVQQKQPNILYILASDVKVTKPRGFLEGSSYIVLKNNIPEKETVSSLFSKNLIEVKAFHSLYQALEYAHFLQHGGLFNVSEEEGFIPSLWMVSYIGNLAHVHFKQEEIWINEGKGSTVYSVNERDVIVSYATLPKDSLIPLFGTTVFPRSDFASYEVLNNVDFKADMQKHGKPRKCTIM